jgi:Tfp pilus assembly protein PilP
MRTGLKMTRNLLILLASATIALAPARAQDPAPIAGDAGAPSAQTVADVGVRIDEILEGEEAVLQGGAYSYDPGDRRDPFKSLETAQTRPELDANLPEGVPGLLIDEVDLTGIYHTSRGYIAQLVSPGKDRSYLVRVGDQLYDGDVVRITQQEIVFKQIVNDPTVLKPYREVVKKLSP